jgi:hypothetical protein
LSDGDRRFRIVNVSTGGVPPISAKLSGVLSIALWAGVVVAGRMIAYNWFVLR